MNRANRKSISIIATLMLVGLSAPAAWSEAIAEEVNSSPLANRIDGYLSESVENGFSGAVLIADKGQIILSEGYGLANKENDTPNTPRTVFDVGSLTKQFTGAAILTLVQQGKLDPQDTLDEFFENVPNDKQRITIHQLLTHTSGLPQFSGDDYAFISRSAYLEKVFAQKLLFLPGEKFDYSNVGYSVLGIVIEIVSGQEYEQYVYQHLFKPAGMADTGYLIPDWSQRPVVVGYNFGANKKWGTSIERWREDGGVSWHLKANGGILSTIEDMFKWHVALQSGDILTPAMRELYTAEHVDLGQGRYYAYGWRIITAENGEKIVAHNGSNFIFFAAVIRALESDKVAIFMTNEGRRDVFLMSRELSRMLTQPGYEPSPLPRPTIIARMRAQMQMMGL